MELTTVWVAGLKGYASNIRMPFKNQYKCDTDFNQPDGPNFIIGNDDYRIIKNLTKEGPEHRKGLRGTIVWVEINAPRYWWSQADTYKTILYGSSESTMHTLWKEDFGKNSIEFDWGEDEIADEAMEHTINALAHLRDKYNDTPKNNTEQRAHILRAIKNQLPEGYLQKRGIAVSYETLTKMYEQRKDHRLKEWNTDFVNWVHTLPYNELITHEW